MNRKFVLLMIGIIVTPLLGLGGYFLMLIYRPFESRIVVPEVFVEEYDGPGSLKQEREREKARMEKAKMEQAKMEKAKMQDELKKSSDDPNQ
jgi:hypothetical protein